MLSRECGDEIESFRERHRDYFHSLSNEEYIAKRKSIYIEGFSHVNPIPIASRIGNLIVTGAINGVDPATGKVAPTLEQQCAHMFTHVRRIVEKTGGGSTEDIIKMTV